MVAAWIRRGIVGIAVIVLVVQWAGALWNPRGDFLLHWEFGRRLRSGEFLYFGGMHAPYPPSWAVPHVPLSLLEPNVAKAAFFLIGVAALAMVLWLLNDLSRTALPLGDGRHFWVTAAALFICSRFITRDFDDGGQNVVFLALTWLAVWLVAKERPWSAGVCLGLSIALKCTAAMFLLYFLLKRQWKMAASSALWTAAFFATPIFWQGPSFFVEHLEWWQHNLALRGLDPDPSRGALGAEVLQNKSLRPSLARYLMKLPPGHPGRYYIDDLPEGHRERQAHPWSIDFLDFSPSVAGPIIKGLMLIGLVAAGCLCRQPLSNDDRLTYLWEASIVGVLMLLYSPLTWGQHCVAALPAFYLLARAGAAERIRGRWLPAFLAAFTLVLLASNRTFIGKDLSVLVESYHPVTFALLILVVVLFVGKAKTADADATTMVAKDDDAWRFDPGAKRQAA